jgi:pimeloyl-ACP methyl ester carboxylesterase
MSMLKKIILRTLSITAIGYGILCLILFFMQEQMIFFPEKLDSNYQFHFSQPFEELRIPSNKGYTLHGLLFRADSSKGLIFYLHGNAGSLRTWGDVANTYTQLGYSVFLLDYPGYGKSEGTIRSQDQLFDDVQSAYNELKRRFAEEKTIVLGYSIGSGLAAHLASVNNPKMLILQAPYYSLTDLMKHYYPIIPGFVLKYKFETAEYLQTVNCPIVLFHGDHDEIIYYASSQKIRDAIQKPITLITLVGQGHNGITENPAYKKALAELLGGGR